MMSRKPKKRGRGRPAIGHDPIVPVRLPRKLISDIEAWASVYRNDHELEGMNRSTAIRCLILMGLESPWYRAVDPKDNTSFEGATAPLLKFHRRPKITKWLLDGTGKTAKQKPPIVQKLGKRPQQPTVHQVQAAADRAAARSKERKP